MTATARTDFRGQRLPVAEAVAWHLDAGDGGDRKLRRRILSDFPDDMAERIALRYVATATNTNSVPEANGELLSIADKFGRKRRALASSDDDLIAYAQRRAEECRRLGQLTNGIEAALDAMVQVAAREGVTPPEAGKRGVTVRGAVARLMSEHWWRRAARRTHGREVEGVAITLGMVHKRAAIYASDPTVKRRAEQRRRNLSTLQAMQAVNELGQEYTLDQLAALSVSNPVIRRGELMTRIAGFEQLADRLGHVGMFYTITCPSRMHARHSESGEENEKYDGTTPREAQHYLCGLWSRVRAVLGRRDIQVYGFRIAEPHHDGCPHWHLLLWMRGDDEGAVTELMRRHALAVEGHEHGASKHRFKSVEIDKSKGTAAGYVAKYVAKNIDGFGVEQDLFGKDPKKSAKRVDAWASTWGIRQFQQIGGPPVTVWRELRRVSEAPEGILEDSRKAADDGEWSRFVELQGGPTAKRAERPVITVKRSKESRYGEESQAVVGVAARAEGLFLLTRVHQWTLRRKPDGARSGVSESVHGVVGAAGAVEGVADGGTAGADLRHVAGADRTNAREASCNAPMAAASEGRAPEAVEAAKDAERRPVEGARDVCAPWSPVNNCTRPPRMWRSPRLWKLGPRWYAARGVGELYGPASSHNEEKCIYCRRERRC